MVNFGSIRRLMLMAGVALLPSISASPAAAVVMTATYRGTVASGTDGRGVFGGGDLIGKTYEAVYTYDTDDLEPFFSNPIVHLAKTARTTLMLTIGNVGQLQFATLYTRIVNNSDDVYSDQLQHDGYFDGGFMNHYVGSRNMIGGLLADQTVSYAVGEQDFFMSSYRYGDSDTGTNLEMSITSIDQRPEQVAPVPEPASWALMLTGFATMARALRVRRRRLAFI